MSLWEANCCPEGGGPGLIVATLLDDTPGPWVGVEMLCVFTIMLVGVETVGANVGGEDIVIGGVESEVEADCGGKVGEKATGAIECGVGVEIMVIMVVTEVDSVGAKLPTEADSGRGFGLPSGVTFEEDDGEGESEGDSGVGGDGCSGVLFVDNTVNVEVDTVGAKLPTEADPGRGFGLPSGVTFEEDDGEGEGEEDSGVNEDGCIGVPFVDNTVNVEVETVGA